jgi:maltooligosyltrehalose synthase
VITLPAGKYLDVLTGRAVTGDVTVADVLAHYPVALLLLES